MRARRREINIFNMSLLDILCGALGAFCFMMLVALPYYKPSQNAAQVREQQEKIEQLMQDMEKLKTKMADPSAGQDLEALLRQLRAQIQALQGQVNDLQRRVSQLTADKQQLTATNKDLTAANEKLQIWLAQKKPFIVIATADDMSQTIDVMVMRKKEGQHPDPGFNAWLGGELGIFNQVRVAFLAGRGTAMGMVTDVPIGTQYNLYVRLANDPTARQNTAINSVLFADETQGPPTRLPKVTLSPERSWTVLGTITVNDLNQPFFKEATAEERDAEWKSLTNSTPPPMAAPPPPQSAESIAAAAAARERRKEASKKFARLQELVSKPSESNEAEILALTDQLLKELPAKDGMRAPVQGMRQRTLAEKLRREGGQQPQPPPPTPQEKSPGPAPAPRP